MIKLEKVLNVFGFYLILSCLLIYSLGEKRRTRRSRVRFFLLFIFVIIIFFGFRDIGLDIEPYKNVYDNYSRDSYGEGGILEIFTSMVEPVHSLIISFLKSYALGFWSYLFIAAAIPILIISIVVVREERYPVLSLYFFVFAIAYPAMDAVRHFVAAGIFFGALYLASLRKIGAYHVVSFLSFLSHYSNAITLFLYPIIKLNWLLKTYLFLLIFTLLFSMASGHLFKLFLDDFTQSGDVALLFKINYYLNFTDEYEYLNNIHFWLLQVRSYFYLIFVVAVNIYILNKRVGIFNGNEFHRLIFNSQIIGSVISVFFIGLGAREFAVRVNFLMSIGSFVLLAAVVRHQSGKFIFDGNKFIFITSILVVYNIIILFYLIGIHQPASPFYMG